MNELCETPVVKLSSNEVISLAGTHPCRRKLPEDFSFPFTGPYPSVSVIQLVRSDFLSFLRITIQKPGS